MNLNVTINEVPKQFPCQATDTLLDVLRREGYPGVKIGCANGDCGTCAVLLNGRTINYRPTYRESCALMPLETGKPPRRAGQELVT